VASNPWRAPGQNNSLDPQPSPAHEKLLMYECLSDPFVFDKVTKIKWNNRTLLARVELQRDFPSKKTLQLGSSGDNWSGPRGTPPRRHWQQDLIFKKSQCVGLYTYILYTVIIFRLLFDAGRYSRHLHEIDTYSTITIKVRWIKYRNESGANLRRLKIIIVSRPATRKWLDDFVAFIDNFMCKLATRSWHRKS